MSIDDAIEILKYIYSCLNMTFTNEFEQQMLTTLDMAIKAMNKCKEDRMISERYKSAYQQGYSDAMCDLRKEPKTGHWTNGDSICPCCGEDKFKDLDADIYADWRPNYCPNCGAKMEDK